MGEQSTSSTRDQGHQRETSAEDAGEASVEDVVEEETWVEEEDLEADAEVLVETAAEEETWVVEVDSAVAVELEVMTSNAKTSQKA